MPGPLPATGRLPPGAGPKASRGTRNARPGYCAASPHAMAGQAVGLHLARLFIDFEPGIHWPQVQIQSGITGINTIRIYNPVKQGLDQDPEARSAERDQSTPLQR